MRLSHPGVWVALVALGLVLGLVLLVVRGIGAVTQAVRRRRWPSEREARRAWERATVRLESVQRITEAGDFRIILGIPPSVGSYRTASTPTRLRSIVRITEAAAGAVEQTDAITVLINPDEPAVIALDFDSLLGDRTAGDALARETYVLYGRTKWTLAA